MNGYWTIFGPDGMQTMTRATTIWGRIVRTGVRVGSQSYLAPEPFASGVNQDQVDLALDESHSRAQPKRRFSLSFLIRRRTHLAALEKDRTSARRLIVRSSRNLASISRFANSQSAAPAVHAAHHSEEL
jgi:hypothetical protein